jgi:hypothetical protein
MESGMAGDSASEIQKISTVIARSLAFLCLQNTDMKNGTVLEKSQFLIGLGLSNTEAAEILGTTAETVRVSLGKAKRMNAKGKKRGKEAKAKRRTG